MISESEIEYHTDDHPPCQNIENPRKELMLKPTSSVCVVSNEPLPIIVCLKNFLANNQFATFAICGILVAIIAGIFCQLSMMLNGSHVPPQTTTSDVNLLLCQNKVKELERENGNLKIEMSILQRDFEAFKQLREATAEVVTQQCPECQKCETKYQQQQQFKHKKVKTKYDSFKRPPVAGL